MIDDEKLLLAEYLHFSDGLFKNEEIGERRIEFFVTIATAVLAGVALLLTSDRLRVGEESVRKIALAALLGLLLLGIVTFSRILQRDKVTAEYKRIQRYLREELRKRSASMEEYDIPFASARHKLLRGGLAVTAAGLNSLIVAFFIAIFASGRPMNSSLAVSGFVLTFSIHALFIIRATSSDRAQFYRVGAGAIITNGQKLVLALKRKGVIDAWQVPQGGLKPGEAPLEGIFREIREETGIPKMYLRQLEPEPALMAYEIPAEHRTQRTGRGQVHYWFLFKYEGNDSQVSTGDGLEFTAWKWMRFQDLAAEVVPFKRHVYQCLLKKWVSELDC